MSEYKEGVDFEWVLMKNQPKGGTNKTRRFFSRAEKEARKNPKPAEKPKAAPAKKAPVKAPAKEKPVTKDAMKGYRAGDVKTSKLPGTKKADPVKPVVDYQPPPRGETAGEKSARLLKERVAPAISRAETPVPGRAIVKAIKNAWSGKGETDAAKITRGKK